MNASAAPMRQCSLPEVALQLRGVRGEVGFALVRAPTLVAVVQYGLRAR